MQPPKERGTAIAAEFEGLIGMLWPVSAVLGPCISGLLECQVRLTHLLCGRLGYLLTTFSPSRPQRTKPCSARPVYDCAGQCPVAVSICSMRISAGTPPHAASMLQLANEFVTVLGGHPNLKCVNLNASGGSGGPPPAAGDRTMHICACGLGTGRLVSLFIQFSFFFAFIILYDIFRDDALILIIVCVSFRT